MAPTTEITLVGDVRHRVDGNGHEVERAILAAARGSIMEFAWLVDSKTGERLGINPALVVSLRADTA